MSTPSWPLTAKRASAPVDRPIQLRCMSLIDSDQSSRSRSASSRSAYAVIRIIHCLSGRLYTGKLPRSLRPSAVTSSLASTVPRPGTPVHRRLGDVREAVGVDEAPLLAGGQRRELAPAGDRSRVRLELGDQLARSAEPDPRRRRTRSCRSAGRSTASTGSSRRRWWRDPAASRGRGRAPASAASSCAMFASVVTRGCVPVCTAYCSAGSPNAS